MQVAERKIENPYVGPRPFEERHQRRFFGRDWEADELVSLIVAHPAVLLYAQSGAGKTSLINAKLLPMLRDGEGLQVMPVARVRGEAPQGVQPEQIKNIYVFSTLLGWIGSGADPTRLVDLSLSAFLQGRPRPKDEEAQPFLRVVIFDQFEELFALYPEHWTEREGFFAQVAEALAEDPFLRVLFVLREDYLAQFDPYLALLPERLRTRFRLERLRQEAALAAVKGPLVGTERSFAPGVAESLVEELLKIRVETRTGQMVEVPGEFVEPVQLQVVCRSLWEDLPADVTEITQAHRGAFGDVDQALRTFYERAIKSAVQQTEIREGKLRTWFERELITPVGTRGTAYRGTKSTEGVPNAAIDVLDSQHIIRAELRAGARWYELTHDRFIGPIQRSNATWRAARRERWLRLGGGVALVLVLLFVGISVLQAVMSKEEFVRLWARATVAAQEVAQVQATATVAAQGTGTVAAQVEATATAAEATAAAAKATATAAKATATAALDPKIQATAASQDLRTAQAQATAAFRDLRMVQAQATATSTPPVTATLVTVTPEPGGTETPSLDPTAAAVIETATAAAQSLQIAEQKVTAAAAELKATATAAASATATARELGQWLQTAGLTGRGVKVAILSTGIDATPPDFGGRIAANEDFTGEGIGDGYGLGTFLASIVAGNGAANGGQYKGWAPEAVLYIAKVIGASGAATPGNVIAGLKWAVEQRVDIVLVDVGGAPGCDGSDELSREADAAVGAGLVVVVPAGNSGPESGTVGSPGCARLPITVGAAELNTVANYSSRGPTLDGRTKPDLLFSGYGVGVQAAGTTVGSVVAPGYVEVTGSSVAAAHAAGAIALLLQADPDLTPAGVKVLLAGTATDLGAELNAQGAGLANIERALARVRERVGRIAFASNRDGNSEIYVMNADGSELKNLTDNPADEDYPSWSPDSTRIAFTSDRDGQVEIYVMNADGSGVTRLTNDPAEDYVPSWSPDGTHIAFRSNRDGNREIYVMNADGSGVTRLTNDPALDSAPSWSPDGRRIAFYSDRDGDYQIYVMNADGSERSRLTNNSTADYYPSWSPDGTRIAFTSSRDGNQEIYVMNADGSGQTRLTDNPADDYYSSWSPDGARIAFTSERDGNAEIYVINADGSGLKNLTNNPANDWWPSWSPAGTRPYIQP